MFESLKLQFENNNFSFLCKIDIFDAFENFARPEYLFNYLIIFLLFSPGLLFLSGALVRGPPGESDFC